jgi:hypothetical protein
MGTTKHCSGCTGGHMVSGDKLFVCTHRRKMFGGLRSCNITNITIPNGVKIIDDRAFYRCESLVNVSIPEGVTTIGAYAFYGCKYLRSVIIPRSVENIGAYAFYGCVNLADVTFLNDMTHMVVRTLLPSKNLRVYSSSGDGFVRQYCKSNKIKWKEADADKLALPALPAALKQTNAVDEVKDSAVYLAELDSLGRQLPNKELTARLTELITAANFVYDYIYENPGSERLLNKKFNEYYFPTLVKLIKAYYDMRGADRQSSEMSEKIEAAVGGIINAFKNQLDILYKDKSIDVLSDLDVLNHMLLLDGVKRNEY